MGYKQLNYLQRCKIQAFWKAGYTEQQIADEIGFSKSTISREFSRNMTFIRTKYGYWTYKADYAQTYAENRRKNKKHPVKFNESVETFVKEKLLDDWSPEQISGFAAKNCIFWISHERIYQFILKDKKQGGDLYKHLRHQHKKLIRSTNFGHLAKLVNLDPEVKYGKETKILLC
jgi:transposase, IS30 family